MVLADYLTTSIDLTNSNNVSDTTIRLAITSPKGVYLTSSILWGNNSGSALNFNSDAGCSFNKSDGSTQLCSISSSGIFTCNGLLLPSNYNINTSAATSLTINAEISAISINIYGNVTCDTFTCYDKLNAINNINVITNLTCSSRLTCPTIYSTTATTFSSNGISVSNNSDLSSTNGTTTTIGNISAGNTLPTLYIFEGATDQWTKFSPCVIVCPFNSTCSHLSFIREGTCVYSVGYYNDNTNDLCFFNGDGNKSAPVLRISTNNTCWFFNDINATIDDVQLRHKTRNEHKYQVSGIDKFSMNDARCYTTKDVAVMYNFVVISDNLDDAAWYPLTIRSSVNDNNAQWAWIYYFNSYGYLNQWQVPGYTSIKVAGTICTPEMYIYSDKRIKTNIIDIDDISALDTLRLIKPKRYNYIDIFSKSAEPVWGFIAQEVAEVLPYSVTISTDRIPNVFDIADVSADNVTITLLNKSTSLFERDSSGTLLKISFLDINKKTFENTIVSIIDDKTFVIADALTSEQIGDISRIFVYGSIVHDFHNLDKAAIYTIATAALQEIDREYQTTKMDVVELDGSLNQLLFKNDVLRNSVNELNNKINLFLSN